VPDVVGSSFGGHGFPEITAIAAVTTSRLVKLGGAPTAVALADVDGDGKLDLLDPQVANGSALLQWSSGDGRGSFGTASNLALTDTGTGRIVARDLDGDSEADVAMGTNTTHLTILRGNGAGLFKVLTQAALPGVGPADVLASGDLDGDGLADLLGTGGGGALFAIFNHGGFSSRPIGTAAGLTDGTIADLDGDGRPDIAVSSKLGPFMFVQDSNGTFGSAVAVGDVPGATAIAVGDENGDHKNDIIVGSNNAIDVFLRR
jgi:hypothetical protein